MPRPPVRVGLPVRRLGERQVHRAAGARGRRAVYGRTHQGVAERDPAADRQQAVVLRRGGGRGRDAEQLRRPPHQQRITDRLRSRDQQQQTRVLRERLEPTQVTLLDAPGKGVVGQHAEPARQLGGGQSARELEERERIAAGLGNDPVAHPLVEAPWNPRREQRARVLVAESLHHELREPVELPHVARLTNCEHHSDRLRLEAARDEGQDIGGLPVEPLHVVDHAQERPRVGDVGKKAERGEAEQKAIRRRSLGQAEHQPQRLPLRRREMLDPLEHPGAHELLQPGQGQLHLRLDSTRPRYPAPVRAVHNVIQQNRLPHPGLAPHHQHRAPARPNALDHSVERDAFGAAASQPRRSARQACR